MGSKPNWYQIGIKTYYIPKLGNFMWKKYMLTGLSVTSLASKCVFCRPEHNPKERPHRTEF